MIPGHGNPNTSLQPCGSTSRIHRPLLLVHRVMLTTTSPRLISQKEEQADFAESVLSEDEVLPFAGTSLYTLQQGVRDGSGTQH